MLIRLYAALCAALVLAVMSFAHADDVERGEAIARDICAPCHAIGTSGESPHASAPPFRRLGERVDLDDLAERLREGVIAAHPEMPTVRFSWQDARAFVAYLRSIEAAR